MSNAWVLRKGERVYVFQKRTLDDGETSIEIFDYTSMESYHADAWNERRSGTNLEYARGVWDRLVEEGFAMWHGSTFVN